MGIFQRGRLRRRFAPHQRQRKPPGLRQAIARIGCAALLALAAAWGSVAQADWGNLATISMTDAVTPKLTNRHLCFTDGRDIACNANLYLSTGGLLGINTSNPNAQVDVYGTVSATNFVGDGSGLTGVVAGATDRIVSGTNAATRMVAISSTGYISITQAGANAGWFSPYTGLVTLGVSSTGPISGTAGYFSGNVGIGTTTPAVGFEISGTGPSNSRIRLRRASGVIELAPVANGGFVIVDDFNNQDLIRFGISSTGNVSINANLDSSSAKLTVGGTISASDAIQVGISSLTCSSGIAGALRYASGNIQLCNGTAWGNLVGAADAMGDRIVSGTTNAIAWQDRSLTITTAGSQRMIVGEDGRIGIGTEQPAAQMHVVTNSNSNYRSGGFENTSSGASAQASVMTRAGTNEIFWGTRGSGYASPFAYAWGSTNIPFVIATSNSEKVRVLANGNVGVATSLPNATLQVSGTFSVSTSTQGSTSPSFYIGADGNVGIGTSAPTASLNIASFVPQIVLRDNTTGADSRIDANSSSGSMYLDADYANISANSFLGLGVDGVRKMYINLAGVSISKSAALAALDVGGTISASDAIQVGTSTLTCGGGIPGAIRYQGTSLQYCNGTTWTTLGAAGGGLEDRIVSGTTSVIASEDRSLTISTAGSQRMIVGENGNVGIGTMIPTVATGWGSGRVVHLEDTTANLPHIRVKSTNVDAVFGVDNGRAWLGTLGGHPLTFMTGGTTLPRMTIMTDGSIGVGTGTTAPSATLHVSGTIKVAGTGAEACDANAVGSLRRNPATGRVELCQ